MIHLRRIPGALAIALALVLAACSGGGSTPSAALSPSAPASIAPSPSAASESPSPSASASASASEAPSAAPEEATVVVAAVAAAGDVVVAGSNGMTLYTFTEDTAGSGTSACTGGCIARWPALTVAAGETPSAGDGVTGTLGTITRSDDGTTQVTYDGLPLYFFANDHAPGDANGIYDKWEVVKP